MTSSNEFSGRMQRLEELLTEVELAADERSLTPVRALVRTLMDVHCGALEQILGTLGDARTADGRDLKSVLLEDPAVSSLLLMHDLHPSSLTDRARRALDEAHSLAGAHATAELVRIDGERVFVRIREEKRGAAALLRKAVERTLGERTPDALFEIEGGDATDGGFVPVSRLHSRSRGAAP